LFVDGKPNGRTPADVELPPGKHSVRLEHMRRKPVEQTVEIETGKSLTISPTMPWFRDAGSFALLVGVRQATEGLPVFRYASTDMSELARTLSAAGYAKGSVAVLSQTANGGRAPTAERIRQAILDLVKDRIPDDTLLLALDGPAIVLPNGAGSFFCPADSDLANPETLVSLEWTFQQLNACPATKKVVLIDGNRNGMPAPVRFETAKPGTLVSAGVTALMATTAGKPGYVLADERHGVYWNFVLRGLRGAAAEDGKVTVGALARYVIDETRKYVEKTYKVEQLPNLVAPIAKSLSATLATPDQSLQLLNDGDSLLEKEQYDQAADRYGRAIALRNDLVEAYLHRAVAHYRLGNFDSTIADCNTVLQYDPGNAAAFDYRADAHYDKSGTLADMNLSEMELALQDYDAAIEADPDFAPTYHGRGITQGSLAQARKKEPAKARALNEEAVKDFSRAIDLAPGPRSVSFEMRARAYKRLDKLERAADDYTAALQTGEEIKPKRLFFLYYNRGNIYFDLKKYNRAEADFAKAATLDPEDPDPHKWRARALDGLNRKDEARKERDKEADLRRRHPGAAK
jgi:tetratricopeptide (TPR) repeat protein